MSYTYLLEQGEESSAASFSGIPQSVLSRLTHTAKKFYCNANGMESFQCSPYGEISENLTGNLGEELPMSFVADSHAPTFHVPVKARESKVKKVDSGVKWPESLAKYDPNTHSWRTPQCLLFEDSTECLETFPRWGSMLNGECWERTMLALPTAGRESGLWATPSARDWKDTPGMAFFSINADGTLRNREDQLARQVYASENATGGQLNPTWVEWLMGWPIGWTDLKPLETDKFQQWQHSHGEFLEVEND
jgi:hypothetical protein